MQAALTFRNLNTKIMGSSCYYTHPLTYFVNTDTHLRNRCFQDGGLAVVGYFLARDLMNGASHLFNGVHALVRLAFGDSPFVGADWWTFPLDLFTILGLVKSVSGGSRCPFCTKINNLALLH